MKKELPIVRFKPDCRTFFWSVNDAAVERFKEYGIEISNLPITMEIKTWVIEITDWWKSIDHNPNHQPSENEFKNWERRAADLIDELNEELKGEVRFIFDLNYKD